MSSLYIIKTGSTFPEIVSQSGDFEDWFVRLIKPCNVAVEIFDATSNQELPSYDAISGVILTGSPAMVTDKESWSVMLEKWLPELVTRSIPVLGVCYGHQLLAESLGGRVGNHPCGKEIGTVSIQLSHQAADDPLFRGISPLFQAHVTHTQSALKLPTDAVLLAANDYEPHHAFRVGPCAWGIQFHPEFDADIMRAYINQQREALMDIGKNPETLLKQICETPDSTLVLIRFAQLVASNSFK